MQRDYQIVDPPSKGIAVQGGSLQPRAGAFLAKDRSLLVPMLDLPVIYIDGLHFGDFMVAAAHRRCDFKVLTARNRAGD